MHAAWAIYVLSSTTSKQANFCNQKYEYLIIRSSQLCFSEVYATLVVIFCWIVCWVSFQRFWFKIISPKQFSAGERGLKPAWGFESFVCKKFNRKTEKTTYFLCSELNTVGLLICIGYRNLVLCLKIEELRMYGSVTNWYTSLYFILKALLGTYGLLVFCVSFQ